MKLSGIRAVLLAFTAAASSGGARGAAEMPPEPTMEELCEHSEIVVSATQVKATEELKLGFLTAYRIVTFRVEATYKGRDQIQLMFDTYEIPGGIEGDQRFVNLLLTTSGEHGGCHVSPNYEKGKKYLLFLSGPVQDSLYTRSPIDHVWEERAWTPEAEERVVKELRFLSDPDRFKKPGDNLTYAIPKEAEEEVVELTDFQQKHGYSRRALYRVNGEPVGERAWHGNGKLAYEKPVKDGMRHGKFRAWYLDGTPSSIRPYRKDRLHGILRTWYTKGVLKTSYYIRGEYVTETEYREACKDNMTLEKIAE